MSLLNGVKDDLQVDVGVNPPSDIASGRIAEAFLNCMLPQVSTRMLLYNRTKSSIITEKHNSFNRRTKRSGDNAYEQTEQSLQKNDRI